jgi:hypothetical protein
MACSVAAIATLLLAAIPGIAPFAYVATGLVIAPIYPTGFAWLAKVTPGRRTPAVYLVGSAVLGEANAGEADAASVSYGLYWLLAGVAQERPVLLVADDLQWCDPPCAGSSTSRGASTACPLGCSVRRDPRIRTIRRRSSSSWPSTARVRRPGPSAPRLRAS